MNARAVLALLLLVAGHAGATAEKADLGAAEAHLARARYAAAAAGARAVLAGDESDARAWQVLGDALAAQGRAGGALAAYASALERGTAHPLEVRVAQARLHALSGERRRAEALWQQVLSRWRAGGVERPGELMAAAEAARELGRGDPSLKRTALHIYEEAIRRAPGDPAPRVALGELLLASYNNAEALPLFEQALELDSEDAGALLGLARSHHFDHSATALEAARAAAAAAPGRVDVRVFLARLLAEDEDTRAAEEQLEAALDVNPRSAPALSLLAALRDRAGDDAGRHALMELVALVAPGDASGYVTLAEMAADRRRYSDAVRYAARAVALDPQSWQGHQILGINRSRIGQMKAARRSLEVAFRGDPFNVWTRNTLELLDAMDDYVEISDGRFSLTARSDHAAALAPYLLPLAEAAYDAHRVRYGVEPPVPVRIEIHPEHEDLSVRTLGLVGVDLLGVSFGPTLVLDTPMANPGGPSNWGSVLWHELGHTFQLHKSLGRTPRWLAEGMAVRDEHLAREGWGADVGPGFLQAYAEGRLARASDLNRSFLNPESHEALGFAYLQAGLLAELIERDHGDEALRALLDGYREGGTTLGLVHSVLGLSPVALDTRFDAFMRERFGAALDALTPAEDGGKSRYATLLRDGLEAFERGELDAAERALATARDLIPGHVGEHSPHHALAKLYRARGDRDAAARALERLIAVDANDLDALLALAADREALEDAPGAERALERAMLIQPFDPSLRQRLALLYETRGAWSDAARERAAVIALGPVDPVDARYRLARAASRAGDQGTARREILHALESAPLFEEGLELLLEVRERIATPDSDTAPAAREGEEIRR